MSDLSIKSEGYKTILRDIVVPSTPFCSLLIAITLYSYRHISGKYGIFSSSVFFLIFILTFIRIPSAYRKCYTDRRLFIILLLFFLLINILTACYLTKKINNLITENDLPGYIDKTSIVIDDLKIKRYSSELCFSLKPDNKKIIRGIILYQDEPDFNIGDVLFIHKKIKKISAGNSYNNYLIAQGIHYAGSLTQSDLTIIRKESPGLHSSLQNSLLVKIDSVFPGITSGLMKALFTGNQNYLQKKIIIQYRNSGVLHTLAASGLHVAIFASVPAFLLIPIVKKNIAMLFSLFSVTAYLFLTDAPVSLLRAVIMFALFFIQLLMFRQRNIFNYLMITCSIILILMPWEIFSPGFQLSFGATAGIILFYRQYRKLFEKLPRMIAGTTAVTLAAQVFTIPIILIQMNQINTAGLFSNLIIIPLITLIMGTGLLALLISFLSLPVAVIPGMATDFLFRLTLEFTDFICSLNLNFFIYDTSLILCILFLIGLIPLINHKTIKKMGFYPVFLSVILCTIYLKKFCHHDRENITLLNINSKASVINENNRNILKLNLDEGTDPRHITDSIKSINPDIKIIELENGTYSSLLASKMILNDYSIDEFRFNSIPEFTGLFKKTLFQLEKDNVTVKFSVNKNKFQRKAL